MKKKLSAVDIVAIQSYPIRLPTVKLGKKDYTIDTRLKEFRHIKYGEEMEFVPFNSAKGQKILRKLKRVV
jgi:hypothetical protein